jgi:hypothetical protein
MNATRGDGPIAWRDTSIEWAVIAGLIGALANTLAIRVVQVTPISPGTGGLAKMTLGALNGLMRAISLPW